MSLSTKITLPNGTSYEQPTGIFYGNEFHAAKAGKTFGTVNPSTGKEIVQVQESLEDDINAAVASAKVCFETLMDDITPATRGDILYRFAQAVEADKELIGAIESADSGKALERATEDDVSELINVFKY